MQLLRTFHHDESGQDMVEYALVLAAIAAVAVVGSNSLAGTLNGAFSMINSRINSTIQAA
jgi:pilus assembly protein Flp/PilA